MDAIGSMLYEGKAKKIFAAARPDQVVHYFKDDATAFNAEKRGTIVDKGVVNNKMSERMFTLIEENRIPTHFLKRLSDR
ncbi:MAG: phosphoribosylaminoimidazolesuccinocarboxamide synthase, partial [Nitrospira sp.]|nr:phosphoribosylaminoimidazolesuccinocarboxamide synthase [Nitrospira sp.]MBH0184206.1 phosphoribosylaminoimidazolesuccinocarboxamide synthase [Nitrospira sp.]